MPTDPSHLSTAQIVVSILAVVGATGSVLLRAHEARVVRRAARALLVVSAVAALLAWFRFGVVHRPFQFHEVFHYDLGTKYFAELGYEGLYDCTALADFEIARADGVAPRLTGRVRDLRDVLSDLDLPEARRRCTDGVRPAFTLQRWAAFEDDVRALQRLVPSEAWDDVVDDKGLNPPPTFVALAASITNSIPLVAGGLPTYLALTSIDLLLLAAMALALHRTLGASPVLVAAVTFGASFLASYGWLGAAVLRFTWVAGVVLGLAAAQRRRWMLAGALLGWAACDRVFPAAFLVGAMVPLAWQARSSPRHRRALARMAVGAAATSVVAGLLSIAFFGLAPWGTFLVRMERDVHVHHVLMLGLDKVLTFRSWVAGQDFHGHEGLARFRAWNERIEATAAATRPVTVVLQGAWMLAVAWVARARRPLEASVLFGTSAMFVLASPVSYYWVVLALVPAVLVRGLLRARSGARRPWLVAFLVFQAWWVSTLLVPRAVPDGIVADLWLCVGLAAMLLTWLGASWRMTARPRA